LTAEQVEANVEAIRRQLSRFLDFESTTAPARLVNNAEWLTSLGAIDFMRDVGKHFTVNAMLAKESVKRRIESEEGITYTEFSYSLLQAYDFLELYDRYGCTLQMGGSDQWGNITAGMDLIRRVRGGKAHGLVLPLIATASGTKFGKTEAGTIWLDPELTTPYQFFQFWLNIDDRDAVKYLRFFTFLDAEQIRELANVAEREPEKRHSQRALAREVTGLVHGSAAVADAEAASATLFSGDLSSMRLSVLLPILHDVPSTVLQRRFDGWRLPTLLVEAKLAKSMSDASRLIRAGGVKVNGRRITDEKARLSSDDAIEGQVFVLEKGRKERALVRLSD
jgi:tyrosyl-tRNA synthetase